MLILELPLDFVPGAAIFDCDGTLADTMPLHYAAWRSILDPIGIPFSEEKFYGWGGVTTHELTRRLSRDHAVELDPDDIAHMKEEAYTALLAKIAPIPEVIAEARRLHGVCPLAVASGGRRPIVERTLEGLGIRDLFQEVIVAEDVRHGKPSPDAFLLAAERIGVPPAECVVFEDAPPGWEAARRAGMRAVDVNAVRSSLAALPGIPPGVQK